MPIALGIAALLLLAYAGGRKLGAAPTSVGPTWWSGGADSQPLTGSGIGGSTSGGGGHIATIAPPSTGGFLWNNNVSPPGGVGFEEANTPRDQIVGPLFRPGGGPI